MCTAGWGQGSSWNARGESDLDVARIVRPQQPPPLIWPAGCLGLAPLLAGVNTACDNFQAGKYKADAGVNIACDNCQAGKYKAVVGVNTAAWVPAKTLSQNTSAFC